MKNRIINRLKFGCAIIIIAAILVFSKLFPVIPSPWSADFCTKWNDMWFGLSCSGFCSIIVALIMYYYTDYKPQKDFTKRVKPILKQKVIYIHDAYNEVFKLFGGSGSYENRSDYELTTIMKSQNWADSIIINENNDTKHTYADLVQEVLGEIRRITAEILFYNKYLDDNQIVILEKIVNELYSGIKIAKNCQTDSKTMKQSLIRGSILSSWVELYNRDSFVNEKFVTSYRELLKLERSFDKGKS